MLGQLKSGVHENPPPSQGPREVCEVRRRQPCFIDMFLAGTFTGQPENMGNTVPWPLLS